MRAALLFAASPGLVFLLAIGPAAGCSSSNAGGSETPTDAGSDTAVDDAGSCPNVLPPACPSPEPSYESDVLPILEQRCYTCHADAGITTSGSDIDLGSYSAVYQLRGDILSEVNACEMPPTTAPQPTIEQRTTLLGWLKCGAPETPDADTGD
jgi:hypothetical protein